MKTKFLILCLICLISSCNYHSSNPFKSAFWDLIKSMREPGSRLAASPERIWRKYRCDHKKLPFVDVIRNKVIPKSLVAGGEINHRFIYVMCPKRPTEVLNGTLYRRIFFKGNVIYQHAITGFEISPGQWVVDAFVTIPDRAQSGIYSLEISFNTANPKIKKNVTFHVLEKKR